MQAKTNNKNRYQPEFERLAQFSQKKDVYLGKIYGRGNSFLNLKSFFRAVLFLPLAL